MKINLCIKSICILLIFSIIFTFSSCKNSDNPLNNIDNSSYERYNTPAGLIKKSETVYVNLSNKGDVLKTTVTDWLHTDSSKVYVDDKTNLDFVVNITDDSKPDQKGGDLTWYLSKNDLYYQGETSKELPLSFEFSYLLNGVPYEPDNLTGKSGKLEINIKMKNNKSKNVTVNGKSCNLSVPLIVVGGVMLSEDKFSNIMVKNGQVSGTGSSQYATFVGFPGIGDSLGLNLSDNYDGAYSFNDTFSLSADVKNFEIGNFMFAALPLSSLNLGLNNVTDTIDSVKINLSKLQNIQNVLTTMNASQVISAVSSDSNKLSDLSDLVEQAANLYDNNKALISVLNKYTTNENIETIQILCDYISGFDKYNELDDAISIINNYFGEDVDTQQLRNGLNLLQQLSNDLNNPEVKNAIQNLPQTVNTLKSLQNEIEKNKDLINALKALSENDSLSSLTTAFSELEGSLALEGLSGLLSIDSNSDDIASKMTAWLDYGKTYNIFTTKTDNMISNLSFIFKTDSINYDKNIDAVIDATDSEKSKDAEENNGLTSIFKKIFK